MANDIQEDDGNRVVSRVITVQCTPQEAYSHWRNLSALPLFIRNVVSVMEEGTHSHWVVDAGDSQQQWDLQLIADIAGELMQWETVQGSPSAHRGTIRFSDARQGPATEVALSITYTPPSGTLGMPAAKLKGENPSVRMATDLHRFKQLVEVGTIATTLGQSRGDAQRDDWEDEQHERMTAAGVST